MLWRPDRNGPFIGTEVQHLIYICGIPEPRHTHLEDLAAGSYSVTVTDANMCEISLSATVTQPDEALAASQPPLMSRATVNPPEVPT